ncbi:MAG: hypothetical protein JHC64_24865 [Mycolicibacterium sp.]|nr:hypothetical protein [Mycolicibacterium sp.]
MCFSVTADLVAGAALTPVAVLSLREVRCWRDVPYAALPAVFAAHQLIEALVWAWQDGSVSPSVGHLAALVYVFIAWPLLPALVPVSVMLLEPPKTRRRVAPFVAVGLVVAAHLSYVVLARPVVVVVHPHALEYQTGVVNPWSWATLYVAAIVGALVSSTHRLVVVFGALNLVGLTVVAMVYFDSFTSLWCAYAAFASMAVWLHMRSRRRSPLVSTPGRAYTSS